jgi:L,D-transpeptidase catalytic domain
MKRRLVYLGVALAAIYAVVVGGAWLLANNGPPSYPCPAAGTLVQVDTKTRFLSLCRNGRLDGRFRIARGHGGVNKQREGDRKTPLGSYTLAPARASSRFHLFLPVAYPSLEQRGRGYTGSDIGIHGPHVAFSWLGHATVWVNWTEGCIAVATHGEIEQIARWVRETGATEILILYPYELVLR